MIREAITYADAKIDAYKFLKKKLGVQAVANSDDFTATQTFDIKKDKYRIHYNDKDFNKPVFDIEWV